MKKSSKAGEQIDSFYSTNLLSARTGEPAESGDLVLYLPQSDTNGLYYPGQVITLSNFLQNKELHFIL